MIFLSIPQITYLYYIYKIEEPIPPAEITISDEDALNLWEKYEKNREIKVEKSGPYKVIYSFCRTIYSEIKDKGSINSYMFFPSGSKITAIVVRNAFYKYLSNQRIFSRILSEYTLSIWMSRNWNEKQILQIMMDIENRDINRKYNLKEIIEFLDLKEQPDYCIYCFNEEHKLLFQFIKDYKNKRFDKISEDNKKLFIKKIVLELNEEISKNENVYFHGKIVKKFKEEHGSFFELYVKTILEYAKQNIDGLNSYALLFPVVYGWYGEELEERLYQFIKNNPEYVVQNIDKIKESINLMSFDTTQFKSDKELRKTLYVKCKEHNNCKDIERFYSYK